MAFVCEFAYIDIFLNALSLRDDDIKQALFSVTIDTGHRQAFVEGRPHLWQTPIVSYHPKSVSPSALSLS
jgi:hypothetical protein